VSGAQERIAKLEALLERVRSRGTKDDAAPPSTAKAAAPVIAAASVAAPAAPAAQVATPIPIPTPIPAAPISGIPEVTVGRDVARDGIREMREDGRRISNVPASVRGTTDQELPSVIIAPSPEVSAPLSSPPISSVELEADDVIEAAPAPPPRSLSRPPPPPPPPARSPTIPPPSTVVTPVPVPSASVPAAAAAGAASPTVPPDTVQLSVPTPAPTPIPATRVPQPHIPQGRQSENRLGDADITAGHPVSVDVDLDDEVPTPEPEEQPAPSSSRRPRSEHAELGAALEDDEASPAPHTVPPESGRQASPAPAESGKRSSVPAVRQDAAPPASVQPDIATGRQGDAQVAFFDGEPAVQKPATFGELLDNALAL
jgi:hypothetical protein